MDDEQKNKEIKKLIHKRSGVKIQFGALKKFVDTFNVDEEQSEFSLNCRYARLDECFKKYVQIYDMLVDLAAGLDDQTILENIELDYCEFQESVFNVQFLYKKYLDKLKAIRKKNDEGDEVECSKGNKIEVFNEGLNSMLLTADPEKSETANLKNQFPSSSLGTSQCHSIKLPQISLPRFNGSLDKWLQFRDSFRMMVVNNPSLSELEKFYYLSGNLDGEAKGVIEEIEFSSDGFKLAWDALMSRFDDKKSIIDKHIRLFFNLKAVQKESKSELQKLLDDSLRNVRALENLGEKLSDMVIVYTVKERLD